MNKDENWEDSIQYLTGYLNQEDGFNDKDAALTAFNYIKEKIQHKIKYDGKHCGNCDAKIKYDYKFCPYCGRVIK